jgi:hypothetical protein
MRAPDASSPYDYTLVHESSAAAGLGSLSPVAEGTLMTTSYLQGQGGEES